MPKYDTPATLLLWLARGIPPAALTGYLLARLLITSGWKP